MLLLFRNDATKSPIQGLYQVNLISPVGEPRFVWRQINHYAKLAEHCKPNFTRNLYGKQFGSNLCLDQI